jgi:hypothetical protein
MNTHKIAAVVGIAALLGVGLAACGGSGNTLAAGKAWAIQDYKSGDTAKALSATLLRQFCAKHAQSSSDTQWIDGCIAGNNEEHSSNASSPAAPSPATSSPAGIPQLAIGQPVSFNSQTWKLDGVSTPATLSDADYSALNLYGGTAQEEVGAGSEYLVITFTVTNETATGIDPVDFAGLGWEYVDPSGNVTDLIDLPGQVANPEQPVFDGNEYGQHIIAPGTSAVVTMLAVVPSQGSLALVPGFLMSYAPGGSSPATSAPASSGTSVTYVSAILATGMVAPSSWITKCLLEN